MKTILYIAYRFITPSEHFNLYKPAHVERGGGGQRYIDFPTGAISIGKWRRFFASVPGVEESQTARGPRWQFPIFSIGLGPDQTPALSAVYQRREETVCIANQNIRGGRLPAWLPANGFPEPTDPNERQNPPPGLAVFLVRTYEGGVWAGWFTASQPSALCDSKACEDALRALVDSDNQPGSAGFLEFDEARLTLREDPKGASIFFEQSAQLAQFSTAPAQVLLTRIEVEGYRSIRKSSIELQALNIIIGANGAGKSNLISLLPFLAASLGDGFTAAVEGRGGANSLLYLGAKTTEAMTISVGATWNGQRVVLHQQMRFVPPNGLAYSQNYVPSVDVNSSELSKITPISPAWLLSAQDAPLTASHDVYRVLKEGIAAYHFADTSDRAAIRLGCPVWDNRRLRSDGGNLPAVLYGYAQANNAVYERIVRTLRKVMPQFRSFDLEPLKSDPENILLNWKQAGDGYLLGPHQISDGSLRVMALVTLLLQPSGDFPKVMVIDEPELGLHPDAIEIVAGLINAASQQAQVIVATQSPEFLDHFEPSDIITAEAGPGESHFNRLSVDQLADWLEDYTISELWKRNVLGGGPLP